LKGVVEEIYVTGKGSSPMEHVGEIRAVVGGIEGDRYKEGTGYWTPYADICEITLIEGEDLDEIENEGLGVKNGEHRRNIVTRGVDLESLRGSKFRIGEAVLGTIGPGHPANTSRT
jgi:hypothetical protein